MLGDDFSRGDSRALDIRVQLLCLDDPIVGIEGVLTAEGADFVLLSWCLLVNSIIRLVYDHLPLLALGLVK